MTNIPLAGVAMAANPAVLYLGNITPLFADSTSNAVLGLTAVGLFPTLKEVCAKDIFANTNPRKKHIENFVNLKFIVDDLIILYFGTKLVKEANVFDNFN